MLKLNHLNLPLSDVPAAREFFCSYFGFRSVDEKLNDTLTVLMNDDGFTLVIMNSRMNENGNSTYPDAFHFGFFVDDELSVNKIYDDLKAGGITLGQAPKRIRRSYGFYFHYQEVMIEVAVMG